VPRSLQIAKKRSPAGERGSLAADASVLADDDRSTTVMIVPMLVPAVVMPTVAVLLDDHDLLVPAIVPGIG
jgi:hypothetical protein